MIMHYRKEHIIRSFTKTEDDFTFEDNSFFMRDGKHPSINAAKRASRQIGLGKVRIAEKFPEQPV